jgi:flavin-dependent dehydrogenase
VVRSEPVSPISTSRSTVNRRRHYERLPEPPAGFVAVGDAAAAFNPIFGQGISSALKAASLLGETLDELGNDSSLPGEFHRRLAAWLNVPWGQATGYDLMFPSTVGERTERTPEQTAFAHYTDVLSQLSTVDPAVAEAILVATQSFNPLSLRAPGLVKKAKAWAAEGRTPPRADPSRPPVLTQ